MVCALERHEERDEQVVEQHYVYLSLLQHVAQPQKRSHTAIQRIHAACIRTHEFPRQFTIFTLTPHLRTKVSDLGRHCGTLARAWIRVAR